MVDIEVHVDNLFSDELSPKIVNAIQNSVETSLAVIKDRWQSEAQHKLHSTLPLYLMGLDFNSILYPYEGNAFSGAVQLTGKLPNMLESGFPAFDMKIGFSNSKRRKIKKDGGWYLTIPLRHSTPGAFMYGNAMPKDIYGVAKKLGNGESLHIKGQGDLSWTGYQRKHNTYDGLTRIVKSYNNTTQSQYYTFRRVSDKSDPLSWMHPSYVGAQIAGTLAPFATDTFVKALEHNLNGL